MELIVKGHSGFSIDIVREGTNLYVYKRCCDAAKAERLMRQATKQEQATGFHYTGFQIPHIIATEHNENSASVKMDYIYSRNFMEYFESAGFEQIDYFIKATYFSNTDEKVKLISDSFQMNKISKMIMR